jgi:DNA-directed RNA polymerase III subunit RPC7
MAFNSKFILQAYVVPPARKLSEKEQSEVDYYRHLRERFHEGPYYSVLDTSSSSAKKGSAARTNFDPFHGMPSYSGRYQKKRRTLPKVANIGREYGKLGICQIGSSLQVQQLIVSLL